ncbi:hypothetical protein DBB34_06590 [Sphaerisporangium cinnabarinum]|nr:hypothetical protein [Sphaerisporangium cinnabarinum]PTU56974.1 hypothetical protein DBB34_06590 [Sphaerisporangium cinnabarinum]
MTRHLDVVCTGKGHHGRGEHAEELLGKIYRYESLAERWAREDPLPDGFPDPRDEHDPPDYVHEWFTTYGVRTDNGKARILAPDADMFTTGAYGTPGWHRTHIYRCRICRQDPPRMFRDETLTQYEEMTRHTPTAGRLDVSLKLPKMR